MAPKRGAATDPSAQGTLPEAPTFHPTAAEFAHPMRYILSIREEAEKYGICAIVPPASWRPPFCLDRNRLKFPARVQRINELMVRKVQRLRFLQELSAFWDGRGAPLTKRPTVGGRPLDLHLLHATVRSFGGYEATRAQRCWPRVAEAVHLDCSASHASSAAKRHYEQTLLPFDQAREAVQLQAEARQTAAGGAEAGVDQAAAGPAGLGHGAAGTAVGAGSAGSAATPTTAEDGGSGGGLLSRRGGGAALVKLSAAALEGRDPSNAGMYEEEVIAYEPPEPGKEICEICGLGDNDESIVLCDRCDCGFHLYCLTPRLSAVPVGEWFCPTCLTESFGFGTTPFFKFHQFERQAHAFKHAFFSPLMETGAPQTKKRTRDAGEAMLALASMDYNARAASRLVLPDLDVDPDTVEWQFWNIVTTPDAPVEVLYGSDLDTLTYGSGFPKPRHDQPKPPPKPASKPPPPPPAFTSSGRATGRAPPPPPPEPAKPAKQAKAEGKEAKAAAGDSRAAHRYARDAWNLNNLCRQEECVLSHCGGWAGSEDISGMMVPWLYVGMLFASFCWHVEDHFAHSINFMHAGAPKTWYGVPGHAACTFEAAMKEAVPELLASEAGLLYKMTTMLPPRTLAEAGVPVCRLLQRAGSFVITWPRAYHAGFSHGLNMAESSNFATPDWLPWGRMAVDAYRSQPGTRRPCFTHELLLTTLARRAVRLPSHMAAWVAPELRTLITHIDAALRAAAAAGLAQARDEADAPPSHAAGEQGELSDAVDKARGACPSCCVCEYECCLYAVELPDGRVACLDHAHSAWGAGGLTRCRLVPHRPVAWLRALLAHTDTRAMAAAAWADEAHRVLARAQPAALDAPSLAEAQELLSRGVALGVSDGHMLQLETLVAAAAASASAATAILSSAGRSRRGALPELSSAAAVVAGAPPLRMVAVVELALLVDTASAWQQGAALLLRQPATAEELRQVWRQAEALPFSINEVAAVEVALRAAEWTEEVAALCAPGGGLSLPALQSVVSRAPDAALPAVEALTAAVLVVSEWMGAATSALRRGANLAEHRRLCGAHSQLAAAPPPLPRASVPLVEDAAALADRADAAEAWLREAAPVLAAGDGCGPRVDVHVVNQLLSAAKGLQKVSEVGAAAATLSRGLAAQRAWLDAAGRLFLKQGSAAPLLPVLRRDDAALPWPPTDEEASYSCPCCVTAPAGGAEVTWIGCDTCDGWFHAPCVGIADADAAQMDAFECPRCVGAAGRPWPHGPMPALRRTSRPALAQAEALAAEAKRVWVSLPEAEALDALLEEAHAWQPRARGGMAAAETLLREAQRLELEMPEEEALHRAVREPHACLPPVCASLAAPPLALWPQYYPCAPSVGTPQV